MPRRFGSTSVASSLEMCHDLLEIRQSRATRVMRSRILIVEAAADVGAGVAALLDRAGYESIVVDTVPAGLQILRDDRASLLITASRVNGYNGLQLVAMGPRPIPAIVVAATADPFLEGEARRLGAAFLVQPEGTALLALVEQKLSRPVGETRAESRRWARKRVIGELNGFADSTRVRIVDVSYGGVRFEVDDGARLARNSFHLTLPVSDVDITVDVVWKRPHGSRWAYGAIVDRAQRPAWRRLVDAIA